MPNKIFNIRLRNKRDTEANWEKKDPLILDGETIVVTTATKVYKKVSGTWVEQADLPAIFSGEPSGGASNYVYGGSV